MSNDRSYYAERANQERRRAIATKDADARRIHLDLAAKYATLAGPDIIVADIQDEQKQTG